MAWVGGYLLAAIVGLVDDFEAGTEESVRMTVERMMADEKITEEHRRQRGQQTAFWITRGLHPLAEPLILDWDWFCREVMPTDARYKALFPDDPGKRSRIKDVMGELSALREYSGWALMRKEDPDDPDMPSDVRDESRRYFFLCLHNDLNAEGRDVTKEYHELLASASNLAQFQYYFLDDDGIGTTRIEEFLQKGAHVFRGWDPAVKDKYQHLVPLDYTISQLGTFEWLWLDRDGGVTRIKKHFRAGDDVLRGWESEDIARRYGHLRRLLPRWARFSAHMVDRYGWHDWWLKKGSCVHEHLDYTLCVDQRCEKDRKTQDDIDLRPPKGPDGEVATKPDERSRPLWELLYERYNI